MLAVAIFGISVIALKDFLLCYRRAMAGSRAKDREAIHNK